MKCETCGRDMHWEGSIRTGHMACGKCEGSENVDLREIFIDAFNEGSKKLEAKKQIHIYKPMVGQEAPKPEPSVKWLCLKCGYTMMGIKGKDPKGYGCSRCCTYGSLKEVT